MDFREESNTQWNFADFVLSAIANNHIRPGDYLIADNATVYHGSDTYEIIQLVLQSIGSRLIFLPAYSPELNPCELVFSIMKTYIRGKTQHTIPVWSRVLLGLAQITPQMIK